MTDFGFDNLIDNKLRSPYYKTILDSDGIISSFHNIDCVPLSLSSSCFNDLIPGNIIVADKLSLAYSPTHDFDPKISKNILLERVFSDDKLDINDDKGPEFLWLNRGNRDSPQVQVIVLSRIGVSTITDFALKEIKDFGYLPCPPITIDNKFPSKIYIPDVYTELFNSLYFEKRKNLFKPYHLH